MWPAAYLQGVYCAVNGMTTRLFPALASDRKGLLPGHACKPDGSEALLNTTAASIQHAQLCDLGHDVSTACEVPE